MEFIVNYSDSESDTEDQDLVDKSTKLTKDIGFEPSVGNPASRPKSPNVLESAQATCSKVSKDFFGLENDSNSESESWEDSVVEKPKPLDQGAELPSSAYWKDFSPVIKHVDTKPQAVLNRPSPPRDERVMSVPFVSGGYMNYDDSVKSSGRKVYFVHHVIAQNLTRDGHSRPRSQELKIAAHTGVINRVTWCKRRDYSHLAASCSSDSKVKLWNLFTNEDPCLGTVHKHDKAVSSISWSSNGRNLLSGSYDRSAVISDVERSEVITKFEHSGHVTKVEYHSDDHRLFMCIAHDRIYSWDLRTKSKPVKVLRHPRKEVTKFFDLTYINQSQEIAVSTDSCEHNLCVFDIRSGALVSLEREIFPERYTCPRLMTSRVHGCFLAQTQGSYVCEFTTKRPYKLNKYKRFQGHKVEGYPIGFDLTCDSKTLICGSSDSNLYLYDWLSGKNFGTVWTDVGICVDVACHPVMGNVVLTGSWDGQLALVQ